MFLKVLHFIENSFALGIFVAVVAVSISTVFYLNPQESKDPEPTVAGVSVNQEVLSPNNTLQSANAPISIINKLVTADSYNYTFENNEWIFDFNTVEVSNLKSEFIVLKNKNNANTQITLQAVVPASIKDKVRVYLTNSEDVIILNEIGKTYENQMITIPRLSEKNFELNFEFKEKINYPTQIKIKIG